MLPHAIANLRVPAIAETVRIDDVDKDGGDVEPNVVNSEVELHDVPFVATNVLEPSDNGDYNLLIPEQEVFNFIRTNFVCKKCNSAIRRGLEP
jgi:hypothetical protein